MRTKYVLIERGEGFKNTYTSLKVATHAMSIGAIESFRPVTLSEIKALRANEYREKDYFRHIEEDAFFKAHNGRRCKATIVSGGIGSSEMLAQVEGLVWLQPIYACNIAGKRTWYPETACVYYEPGEVVDVELKVFSGFQLFVCGITPGHFDAKHWDLIKDKGLAFRCDEEGNAVTGLFAQSKKE
jgi:hypothetical protein